MDMLFAPLAAPPLSLDNVLKAVIGVNWRTLGESFVGRGELASYFLDKINGSDEDQLKGVVASYILASEDRSWRMVIWALYKSNAAHLAEHIRSYAEPLEGVLELVLYSDLYHGCKF